MVREWLLVLENAHKAQTETFQKRLTFNFASPLLDKGEIFGGSLKPLQ